MQSSCLGQRGGTRFAWVPGTDDCAALPSWPGADRPPPSLSRPGRPPVPTYVISGGACQERPPGLQAQSCCGAHLAQSLFPRGLRQSPELLWIELWPPLLSLSCSHPQQLSLAPLRAKYKRLLGLWHGDIELLTTPGLPQGSRQVLESPRLPGACHHVRMNSAACPNPGHDLSLCLPGYLGPGPFCPPGREQN